MTELRPSLVLTVLLLSPFLIAADDNDGCNGNKPIGSNDPPQNVPCDNNGECPAVEACQDCGNDICAEMQCVNGECTLQCPIAPVQCDNATPCPAVESCQDCGNNTCAEMQCVNGECILQCSDAPVPCDNVTPCPAAESCQACDNNTCAEMQCINSSCTLVCP